MMRADGLLGVLRQQIVKRFPEKRLLWDARFCAESFQPCTLLTRDERSYRHKIHGLAISRFGALLGSHVVRLTCLL